MVRAAIAIAGAFGRLAALSACAASAAFAQGQPAQNPSPGGTPAPAAQSAAAARHFDILEYVVDGNTVLQIPDIEEAVYPYLGEARTADDVDKARDALEHAYAARGYQTVQVQIPRQGIEGGVIHLQVVENPVGRLDVVGSTYHSLDDIKATAPSVAEGKVPNINELQNDIVALNQDPDMKVTPRLKAGAAPGTVDVDLQVEDKLPLHGSLEVNNQYNQDTQPLRVIGSLSYDNLWQAGHSLNLSYQIAPQDPENAKVLSGNYLARIPRTPVSILAYGVKSDSNVASVASTNIVGKGDIFGLRAIVTLPSTGDFYQSVTAGVDRKDLSQNVITDGLPSNAPVLYYPVTLEYSLTDQPANGPITTADASLNFATPAGSGSFKFDPQRHFAMRDYMYLKALVSETLPLPHGLSLYQRIQGQITGDPLLSSEQLSAGGANTVRGYLEAERLGDYGFMETVELRSPSVAHWFWSRLNDLHFLVFGDGGALWLRQPLAGEQPHFGLGSVGAGLRLTALDNYFNAAVDLAVPLVDGAVTKADDPHVHFRVWSEF